MNTTSKQIKLLIIIPAVLIIAGVVLFIGNLGDSKVTNESIEALDLYSESINKIVVNYNEQFLYTSIEKVKKNEIKKFDNIKVGIVPHHDLASEMLADFFYQLSENKKVDTLIVIGPNHSDIGLSPAISSKVVWNTDFGEIQQNNTVLDQLIKDGFILYDFENFEKEHSIKTLAPFIKYYFPDTKIVPILLNTKHDQAMSAQLSQELAKYLEDENTVLISTIDFSHYLPTEKSNSNDLITLEAIENRDYNFLSAFNNDYFDSPAAMLVTLQTADLLDSGNVQVIRHANSADFLGRDIKESTGYYTIFLTQ